MSLSKCCNKEPAGVVSQKIYSYTSGLPMHVVDIFVNIFFLIQQGKTPTN